MISELLEKLENREDSLIERKPPNCNDRELRKELAAFANAVTDPAYGIIFIGVSDDGKVIGIENTDERQKRIRRVAENDCYPPIAISTYVLEVDGKYVIAIVVPESNSKPHFTGPAYMRIGSECVNATETEYENLINSRSDKCSEILKHKDIVFSVVTDRKKLGDPRIIGSGRRFHECRVISCNQHWVRLYDISLSQYFNEPFQNVSVIYDEERHRPMLLIQPSSA